MIVAIKLDQPRPPYCAGQIPAGLDANRAVAAAMQDERWRYDAGQQRPDVGVAQRLQHSLDRTGARRGAQKAGPPAFRLGIADEARRKGGDLRGPSPIADQPSQPEVILLVR